MDFLLKPMSDPDPANISDTDGSGSSEIFYSSILIELSKAQIAKMQNSSFIPPLIKYIVHNCEKMLKNDHFY